MTSIVRKTEAEGINKADVRREAEKIESAAGDGARTSVTATEQIGGLEGIWRKWTGQETERRVQFNSASEALNRFNALKDFRISAANDDGQVGHVSVTNQKTHMESVVEDGPSLVLKIMTCAESSIRSLFLKKVKPRAENDSAVNVDIRFSPDLGASDASELSRFERMDTTEVSAPRTSMDWQREILPEFQHKGVA